MAPDDETWEEIQIEVPAAAVEIVAATASALAGGVETRDAETVSAPGPGRGVVIAHCRPADTRRFMDGVEDSLAVARAAGLPVVDPVAIRRRLARESEWRDVWKQFFRATRVGRCFVVRPSWDAGAAPPGEHVIDLDPGRAFGTGAHPSTRLAIALAEDVAAGRRAVRRFLDLGCGSGILSIVAGRLWPEAEGLALDLDPEAAACTRENLDRNRVAGIEVRAGTVADAAGTFDLVLANIEAAVLEPLAPDLAARLAPSGALVLSGLLGGDVATVAGAHERAGLRAERRIDEGEWAALLCIRPG